MYSADFRCLALRLLHTFGSYYRAAKACGISTSTLHRWNTMLANRTRCVPPKRKLTLAVLDKIKQMLHFGEVSKLIGIRSGCPTIIRAQL